MTVKFTRKLSKKSHIQHRNVSVEMFNTFPYERYDRFDYYRKRSAILTTIDSPVFDLYDRRAKYIAGFHMTSLKFKLQNY